MSSNKTIRRTIHPDVRILDEKRGIAEYVASDETVDSYREVIRANGWRFTNFSKNAPFVDSHDYSSIDKLVGKVIDFNIKGGKLNETVQWAVDVPDNTLARIGWQMTQGGYLKAVSVGFWPVRWVSPAQTDRAQFTQELQSLGLPADSEVRTIYQEQEQLELSSVIIGANPNALAKAYKAEVISDQQLDFLSEQSAMRTVSMSTSSVDDIEAMRRTQQAFLDRLTQLVTKM
jgi:hypothetical protein